MVAKIIEIFALASQIFFPAVAVDGDQLLEIGFRDLQIAAVQCRNLRHVTDRCFLGVVTSLAALDHPAQHTEVFSESRPDKLPLLVALKPVDAEDLRRMGGPL